MQKIDKIIRIGIYLILLLPIFFSWNTMFPWNFGKTIVFHLIVEVLLVLAIIKFFYNKGREESKFKLNALDISVLLFGLSYLISSFFGVDFNRSFWGDQSRAQGTITFLHLTAFYFLLRVYLDKEKEWLRVGVWATIVTVVSCIIAWIGPELPFFEGIIEKQTRIQGIIGNPIFFAAYLIIPLFLSAVIFFSLSKKNTKWIFTGIGALILVTLITTGVRGALVGLLLGAISGWFLLLVSSKKGQIGKAVYIIPIIVLIIFGGLYFLNQKTLFVHSVSPAFSRMLSIDPSDTTANTRLMAWSAALAGWKEKPIFGWGPENYQDLFDNHYNPRFLEVSFEETLWDKPHNYPIEVLSTTGLIGFTVYAVLIIIFYTFIIKIKKAEEDKTRGLIILLLGVAMAAYIGQSLFAIEGISSQLFFYGILAVISYFFSIQRRTNLKLQENKYFQKFISLCFVFILIFIPYFFYKNYNMYRSSILMSGARDVADLIRQGPSVDRASLVNSWEENALQTLNYQTVYAWENAKYISHDLIDMDKYGLIDKESLERITPGLIDIYTNEIKKNKYSFSLRLWLSQVYFLLGQYSDTKYLDLSNELLLEAKTISPQHQQVPINIAKNYIIQNRIDEAIDMLKKLQADNPTLSEPHWFLGLLLYENGQKEEGLKELEQGLDYGTKITSNLLFMIEIYAKREEYSKIIPLYLQLIDREPGNSSYYASIAATYAKLGDKENAYVYVTRAVELDPALRDEAREFLKQIGF